MNSAVVNVGRIVGPSIAAVLIATGGTGLCFLVNALSYVGTIIAVASMRRDELDQPLPVVRGRGQVREGIRYVQRTPLLRADMLVLASVSLLAFNFPVVLPLLAKITFHGDASTYSLLAAAMGVGALLSAFVLATIARPYGRRVVLAICTLATGLLVAAVSPTLTVLVAALTVVGAGQVITASSANALIQLDAEPAMRGRVSAIFMLANQGATPVGGMIAGVVAQVAGPRWAIGMGGVGAIAAVLVYGKVLVNDHVGAAHRRASSPDPADASTTTLL